MRDNKNSPGSFSSGLNKLGQVEQYGGKKCHLNFSKQGGAEKFLFNIVKLDGTVTVGIENAINTCKVP